MKDKYSKLTKIFYILFLLAVVSLFGCQSNFKEKKVKKDYKKEKSDTLVQKIQKHSQSKEDAVTPPPFSDGIFPCSKCHSSIKTNYERRVLTRHNDIDSIFSHDNENRWCLDCHCANNRDSLVLASGKMLDFKESYKLCGQCHGDKYRDWKFGIHGKRTGEWNGKKQYYLCVSCHNPHSPKFKQLKPLPQPIKQEDIKL
jgi:hypothetical protein